MGWHDVHVHALAFGPGEEQLSFDIDYMFEWVDPAPGEVYYRHWVAPSTLVFHDVHSLDLQLGSFGSFLILGVERSEPRTPRNTEATGRGTEWRWSFDCIEGSIQFFGSGFCQYTRQAPRLNGQYLSLEERGGYSFDQTAPPPEPSGAPKIVLP